MWQRYLKRAFRMVGLDVQKAGAIRGFREPYLRSICQPKTVIDVGVGYGTHALYRSYPDAHFVLVEPIEEFKPAIDEIRKQYDCTVYYNAVGEAPDEISITVDTENPQRTSFETRSDLTATGHMLEQRTVPVTTLDSIYAEHDELQQPILLKIDAEGHELNVIRGAGQLLPKVDIVIAEVSVARRFENGYRFEQFIEAMDQRGFGVFDFLTVRYFHDRPGTRYADVVFQRKDLMKD